MELLGNKYMYNNEAIGIIAMAAVMQHSKRMLLSNALLVLPFAFHPQTVSSLARINTKLRSIEEFVTKYPSLFSNFAERYESLLPISLNCLVTTVEANIFSLSDGTLLPSNNFSNFVKVNHASKRAGQIEKAAENLAFLLQEKSSNLYLHLRIKL